MRRGRRPSTSPGINNRVIAPDANNQSVVVRLNNLTHTWVGDVTIRLSFTSIALSQTFDWILLDRPGLFPTQSVDRFNDNFNGSYSFGEFVGDANGDPLMFGGDFYDFWAFNVNASLPSGDYFAFDNQDATSPKSIFAGLDPNGTWTLHIRDAVGGDVGALGSWNLAFHTVPEPSSVALMALAMTALAVVTRRRRSA